MANYLSNSVQLSVEQNDIGEYIIFGGKGIGTKVSSETSKPKFYINTVSKIRYCDLPG